MNINLTIAFSPFYSPPRAIGRLMISLMNFSEELAEVVPEGKEKFKRHSFSLLDAMANLIGQVDLSISLVRRENSYADKQLNLKLPERNLNQNERGISRGDQHKNDFNPNHNNNNNTNNNNNNNFMLTTFGTGGFNITSSAANAYNNHDTFKGNHQVAPGKNKSRDEQSPVKPSMPHVKFIDNTSTLKRNFEKNKKQINKDAVVQTTDAQREKEFEAMQRNFNDEIFIKRSKKIVAPVLKKTQPEEEDPIIVVRPSLSIMTQGYFCPPAMYLHKKV